jgi:hypothetical protein
MKLRNLLVWSAVIGALGVADGAVAQSLSLRVENGLVTLDARNVTVDEILARWTAATGLSVVSKSGVGSEMPVTLQLAAVPEREALQTVLRDLSGYIMGERRDARTGVVTIDRLLILPSSAAQAPATATAAPPVFAAGRRLGAFTRRAPVPPMVASPPAPVPQPSDAETPVELAPAPGPRGSATAGRLIGRGPGAVLDLTGAAEPNVDPGLELEPELPDAPPAPFGTSRGASRPGEMTPALPVEVGPQIIRSRSNEGPPPQATPAPGAPTAPQSTATPAGPEPVEPDSEP